MSGKNADAIASYLCRELRKLGVEVRRISVIPYEVELIAREVAAHSCEYDLVFTSGGVGPTHDDVTIEGRSEEHTSELQSRPHLVCRLLLEKKKRLVAFGGMPSHTDWLPVL